MLDDPGTSVREFSHPQAGTHPLDRAIIGFILGDVLVHTWDLARATGQNETPDADKVRKMREGLEPRVAPSARAAITTRRWWCPPTLTSKLECSR